MDITPMQLWRPCFCPAPTHHVSTLSKSAYLAALFLAAAAIFAGKNPGVVAKIFDFLHKNIWCLNCQGESAHSLHKRLLEGSRLVSSGQQQQDTVFPALPGSGSRPQDRDVIESSGNFTISYFEKAPTWAIFLAPSPNIVKICEISLTSLPLGGVCWLWPWGTVLQTFAHQTQVQQTH